MRNEPAGQSVDRTQNASPQDVTITDPVGNPLPADHPAVLNPQIGRPVSRGDLTLPENQEPAPEPEPAPAPAGQTTQPTRTPAAPPATQPTPPAPQQPPTISAQPNVDPTPGA